MEPRELSDTVEPPSRGSVAFGSRAVLGAGLAPTSEAPATAAGPVGSGGGLRECDEILLGLEQLRVLGWLRPDSAARRVSRLR